LSIITPSAATSLKGVGALVGVSTRVGVGGGMLVAVAVASIGVSVGDDVAGDDAVCVDTVAAAVTRIVGDGVGAPTVPWLHAVIRPSNNVSTAKVARIADSAGTPGT
jgi:hypothetical protein